MNLHPIFIHFPIAFFTLYAFLEGLRFRKIQDLPYIFYVKAILVISASLGALAALLTGDMAAESLKPVMAVDPVLRVTFHWHKNFADITNIIFGFLALMYLIAWINRYYMSLRGVQPAKQSIFDDVLKSNIWLALVKIQSAVLNTPLAVVLAVLGFVSVTITGGLGGIMVYGDKADPFFAFFYHLSVK